MDMNLNPVNAAASAMSAPAQSAQGLASLGRDNDSMLMHVTPNEVQGLQQLAQNMGGSLTRNPKTGLPEAGFFDKFLAPMAALGVGALTGNPYLAATASGVTKTAQTGDLGAGLLSGIGAYFGADTLKGVGEFGADAAGSAATDLGTTTLKDSLGNVAETVASGGADVLPTGAATTSLFSAPGVVGDIVQTGAPLAEATAPTFGQTVSNIGAGFGKMTEPGGFDAYAQSIGKSPMSAGFSLAAPVITEGLGAMAPSPMNMEEEDSGWGPYTTSAQRRQMRASNPMMMAEGGPILNDGTGLAGLLDKRVGPIGEGATDYFNTGGLKEGAFILPADVVSHYGNGSSKAGLALLAKKLNAKPIHGPGDGMSDDIPTTIEGKQKARVADGEAYVSPVDVKRVGGPKKLYAMMDKIRQARTGTTKQGNQINPAKYLPK
jgi:hypothetical protein